MDVDTIGLGVDFAQVITQAVSTCQVLLAVIGPRWLTINDEDGRRRLDDPNDLVRLEIAAALERESASSRSWSRGGDASPPGAARGVGETVESQRADCAA